MTNPFIEEKQWTKRAEAERNAGPIGSLGAWRKAAYSGKLIDTYWDKDFINNIFTQSLAHVIPKQGEGLIADFGCGTGYVSQTVFSQLGTADGHRVRAIGIDIWRNGRGRSLKVMKQKAPDVQPVQGSLINLPFASDTFHAGIFRFALPFIPVESQPQALKEIYRVMKKGGSVVVLHDGALDTKTTEALDDLYAQGSAASGRWSVSEMKEFVNCVSYERLKSMAEITGFSVSPATDLTEEAIGYYSVKSFQSMYGLKRRQRQKLRSVFAKLKEEGTLPFEPNTLRVVWPMYTCELKKPSA